MEAQNDWKKLGLRVGLEIHQQLKTSKKLFCNCPVTLVEGGMEDVFERSLRPTRSELGEVDIAAYFEWQKGRIYEYHAPREASCLVEADEEPPHMLNREAVEIALGIGMAMNSNPVDEIHVMRKIVIDGSNTTGFQRTALVALGGEINVNGKKIGIQTICVEEDAARKGEDRDRVSSYILDRLGIPLIEISTAPDIQSPEEASEVASWIGTLLRLTGKVRRGIGTIRQDLNISIAGGEKVEIKGVQELDLLPKAVALEAMRQKRLLELREELRRRGIDKEDIIFTPVDVTNILKSSKSKVVEKNLSKPGGKALAILLKKFKGMLGYELQPNRRFGTELADYARFYGDVKGLFHGDELPGYGITEDEVRKVYDALGGDPEKDNFILIVDEEEKALKSLKAVVERIRAAFDGVPRETRAVLPDGTSKFMRPQPGAARMYPETDIPPIPVTKEILEKAKALKPPTPEEKRKYYEEHLGLSSNLAEQLVGSEQQETFERLYERLHGSVDATTIASLLLVHMISIKREGFSIEKIGEEKLFRVLELFSEGKIAKEAIPELIKLLAQRPEADPLELAQKAGLLTMSEEEVRAIVKRIIRENERIIKERGERAKSLLMGAAMKELRGKAQGSLVSRLIDEELSNYLKKQV
ncbi:MAG TPA: Glu-tRNA(Gln) amidotransferase subunit GatE [Fervidicoccus fontis]|uniref:Glutamyl-tRNA(Gln) amidotransferase subunit E n=1 Tax=Fervidicoccus fontis TaxID=683846 RepID=A0A7C2YDI8_9CREN|nr:Glu-tRNA(Gln) amidotransferase subunit GatE [Fervidicoccus fontis]